MSNAKTSGSLDGLKVVDLSRVLGGPYCTQILGDHGADIIKIEPPLGDETRHWGKSFEDKDSSYFIGVNRNKRSMGLDLSCPEGQEILFRFLEGADILVDNFKTGTMEKWGLGYKDVLEKRFPRLIHCTISGFGSDGPFGGFPGYDAIAQAMVGMMSVNGDEASGPTRVGIPVVDLATGLYAVIGILMALQERARSGLGQHVETSLFDSGLAIMHPHIANFQYSGDVPGLSGSAHPNISPYDKFESRTGPIFLGAGNDKAFRRLCTELGSAELAKDPRFLTNVDRITHRSELTEALNELLADKDGEELSMRLLKIGLTAGPVWTTEQAINHEHTKHRGMLVEKDWYKGTGTPIKLSRTEGSVRTVPPKFGQDSRELLREKGFSVDEIEQLLSEDVVFETRRKN
jgi:crotonobetainyl-CoA:carnitine CoA-transferase CaiB-like acyl-CoA transferase